MKNRLFIAAAAAALVFATATFAQDAEHHGKEGQKKGPFVKADKDGDGKLTESEFVEFTSARMSADEAKAKFKELDKDGNGSLSRDEFAAGMPKHKKKG